MYRYNGRINLLFPNNLLVLSHKLVIRIGIGINNGVSVSNYNVSCDGSWLHFISIGGGSGGSQDAGEC